MKRNGSAERRENRGAEGGSGEGVSLLLVGRGLGRGGGPCHLPRNFFDFLFGNVRVFWCILGTCFSVSIRHVKQSRIAVLCTNCQLVSYLTLRTYHPWYHTQFTHRHIYQSQQSAVRQTCSLYYGHSRHTRTCYTAYLYLILFMHFISRDSTPFH